MNPFERLAAQVAEREPEIPCRGPHRDLWTSDCAEEREAATYRCQPCPVIRLCAEAAAGEKWHVWAGRDHSPARPGRPRKKEGAS